MTGGWLTAGLTRFPLLPPNDARRNSPAGSFPKCRQDGPEACEKRFLREARRKVWANAIALNRARRHGPGAYAAVLAQLEELSAAKVTTLQAPGQVLLKLAATGFGVRLPP